LGRKRSECRLVVLLHVVVAMIFFLDQFRPESDSVRMSPWDVSEFDAIASVDDRALQAGEPGSSPGIPQTLCGFDMRMLVPVAQRQ